MALDAASYSNIIEVCKILAEENDLKVTVEESGKGALLAAFGAFVGGVAGGPVGLGVGGTLGSILGMLNGRGKYKSVVTLISEMSPQQQKKLAESVHKCLDNITAADVATLIMLISTNASLKELVIKEIGSFLYREVGKAIC